MTMPHLMNCSHSNDSWCLDCVKKLYDKHERLVVRTKKLEDYLLERCVCPCCDEIRACTDDCTLEDDCRIEAILLNEMRTLAFSALED